MALNYTIIEIFTNEEARFKNAPLYQAVLEHVQESHLAARVAVYKGGYACYENGEFANQGMMALSLNMPVKIEIILPSGEADAMADAVEPMVSEGIMAMRELNVRCYKTQKQLFPRQLRVKDVMTPAPRTCTASATGDEVVRLLLSSTFTGMPVVDKTNRPIGIITQGDLIYRAGMPLRLGLLSETGGETTDQVLTALSKLEAKTIMSHPVVSVSEDAPLTQAVALMLEKGLKRLPVVNDDGILTGILSRLDIFHTIMKEGPDWGAIQDQEVLVGNLHTVSDIMRRDTQSVPPSASVEDVIRTIDSDDIQRVAVVDPDGKLIGLISDGDLLAAFSAHPQGIRRYFDLHRLFSSQRDQDKQFKEWLRGKTAVDIMKTDLVTVREETSIDHAIALMTEKALKRMAVLDDQDKFQGMISRDALLRAGFSSSAGSESAAETGISPV